MKKLLTIAGSDSSGGAGIQADLKTFAANGSYGMSVITAITAQNTLGVSAVEGLSPAMVEAQIDSVFSDIRPDGIKVGMVSDQEIIRTIARKLRDYQADNIVVDPVMVATSGSKLLEDGASQALIEELIPLADIITPNMAEAEILSGIEVKTKEDMEAAGDIIEKMLAGAVLIKGGALLDRADDLLIMGGKKIWLESDKIDNENVHGTGCSLSSAIANNLAQGQGIEQACISAKAYISGAIEAGLNLGRGRGPLNHIYKYNIEK